MTNRFQFPAHMAQPHLVFAPPRFTLFEKMNHNLLTNNINIEPEMQLTASACVACCIN